MKIQMLQLLRTQEMLRPLQTMDQATPKDYFIASRDTVMKSRFLRENDELIALPDSTIAEQSIFSRLIDYLNNLFL